MIDLTTINKDMWWRGIKEAQRGWTQESYQSAWESLGGDFESVSEAVSDHFDDPDAFAAWLHYQAFGKWPSEKSVDDDEMKAFDDEAMYKGLLKVLEAKKIDIPHPQTRLGSGDRATWKPATDVSTTRIVSSGAGAIMMGKTFMLKDRDIPFEFACDIEKVEEKEGKFYLVGVASDNRIDKDGEIISENALREMAEEVSKGTVVLLPSHKSDWDEEMGKVVKAEVTKDNQLKVICELDPENDKAQKLIKAVKAGKKLGLSIGGSVKKAYQKFIQGLNKVVKVIDGIILKHIAVTGRPANPRTWVDVIAKSIDEEVAKMVTVRKEAEGITPQEALEELKEAIAKEDEARAKEARAKLKEALKKEAIAAGKKEAEAEAEAEAMCKEAEAEARKEAEARRKEAETNKSTDDKTVTVKMSSDQYEKVKAILEKEAIKENPIYKELTAEFSKISKELEEMKKMLSSRKGIFKSSDTDKDDSGIDVEKAVKGFLEKTSKIKSDLSHREQEREVDTAFRETLKEYFGLK